MYKECLTSLIENFLKSDILEEEDMCICVYKALNNWS